jgi:hypothetical protein
MEQFRVFEVEGDNSCLAVIPHNRANLQMRLHLKTQKDLAEILSISSDGRIALMERLEPIPRSGWKSKEKIAPEDIPMLNALAEPVKWFIATQKTPSPFVADFLMIDKNMRLKTIQPLKKGEFDFNTLEVFFKDIANGNLTVFKYLITSSGLTEHSTAKFYTRFIEKILNHEDFAANDLGGIYQVSDHKVIDRAITLGKEILDLEKDIYTSYLIAHPNENIKSLEKRLKGQIVKYLKETKTSSFLWPTIKQDIFALF